MGYSGPGSGPATAMTERDSDIEFDFFEELEPREPPPPPPPERQRPPRPPGGPPPRRPVRGPTGVTPLLRLAGLVAFAILVIVLLVYAVQGCGGSSKRKSYQSYFEQVAALGKDSDRIARDLNEVLTTPGIKAIELPRRITDLVQQQQQVVVRAQTIEPPGPLRDEQLNVIEALQFRVGGLRGLADAFQRTAGSRDVTAGGLQLAVQAQRLVASDVVWDDLFRRAAVAELARQGVTGVTPPSSKFVQDSDFGSPRYWVPILERISGAATGGTTGGLHGTGLINVKALPRNQALSPNVDNTVTAGDDLGFAVTVEDTGDAQEVKIKVTLTIQQTPSPIVRTATIDLINPGEQKTIEFRSLGQVQFATKVTLKVDVQPVPGERNTNNNSAAYPVIFSLG